MSAKRKPVEAKPLELAIAVKGEIVSSNFEDFKAYAEAQIMAISFDLKTDEDFAQADEDAKGLKKFEGTLTQAKADALAQMDELNSLLASVDELGGLACKTRLELERRVKDRKQEVRDGIVRDGIAALEVRNREFSDMIGEAIKGKSALVKMQEAVTDTVERINARILANREVFANAKEEIGDAVAYGEETFVAMTVEAAKVEMERRIERHNAAIKEAELKAERDRLQKEADERERKERLAEQARIETERARQQAEREAQKAAPAPLAEPTPAAAPATVPTPTPAQSMIEPATEEDGQTPADEFTAFTATLQNCLAPVRAARLALKHSQNVARAEKFAISLNAAWQALISNGNGDH